jgi:hypothetical protein
MKKSVLVLSLLILLAAANVAQAYVFQLYDSSGANIVGSTATASFTNSILAPGSDSKTFYFSVARSEPSSIPTTVDIGRSFTYDAQATSWQASYVILPKDAAVGTLPLAFGYAAGIAPGNGFGLGTTNGLNLNTIYALSLDNYLGSEGSAAFSVNLTLPKEQAATPIPAAVWLMGSGLMGLVGLRKKFKA